MLTIMQMSVAEVIANERDHAGTTKYVKAITNRELDRQIDLMTAYGLGLSRIQIKRTQQI